MGKRKSVTTKSRRRREIKKVCFDNVGEIILAPKPTNASKKKLRVSEVSLNEPENAISEPNKKTKNLTICRCSCQGASTSSFVCKFEDNYNDYVRDELIVIQPQTYCEGTIAELYKKKSYNLIKRYRQNKCLLEILCQQRIKM